MRSYERRQRSHSTTRPVHVALATALESNGPVEVYTFVPELSDKVWWKGLPIDLILGLEAGLIREFHPVWPKN